ncbi:Hypothetical protein NCS54_01048500 [Fusarium falciforme]|uniref:Hypothetical protein n=1 Tax=Fusarium falciforme TaxID=195108 RepID=UPI0023018AFE|nr:Hypothetical protein NCS54_01048500 [Fusarium falciforme]WAO92956.1 Hypothetical protein NCS54_01048500 [Fusarium falciforme]
MPSFGRLGKHSNRSSQALASSKTPATTTTPSATSGSAATGAPAATTQATGHQRQPSHQQQQQQQQLLDEADSAAHSAHSGHGFGHSHNASANASNPANSSATPHSALSSSHNTAYSSSESFDSRQPSHLLQQQHQHQGQQQLHLQHPQQQHQPQTPLLPSPSSASAGGAPPPPHLYSSPSAASSTTGANVNNPPSLQQQQSSNLSGFDGHQPHSDFVDPGLGRSQSIRYSSATPYDIATSSVDDLNSHAAGYGQAPPPPAQQLQPPQQQQQQQPQATPQKLSTRKLIKGIFSGSNRGASDSQHHHGISIGHGHHHSYDNTGGLARRPSKRPNSPKPNQPQLVNPGYYWRQPPSHPLPPPAQAEQIQQVQQVPDNPQSPYPPQLSSRQGLDDINEHYSAHDSNSHSPSQNSRISLHNTIRQVSGGEVDQQQHSANYEDVAYRQNQAPPQQQQQPPPQPHVQVHTQDQQPQTIYETSVYDQQPSPLNPPQHPSSQQPYPYPNSQQPGYHQGGIQGGDLRTVPAHLGTVSQFQNPETVSQFSHESPITDSDQRSANLQSASTSPAVNHSVYIQNHGSTTSLPPAQQITPQPQQSGMAPPAGGPPPSRRPEADKLRGQVDPPAGPPPTYRHSTSMNNMNPLPPVPQGVGQPQAYQGNRPPQFEGDQGRDSPQPVSAVPAEPAGDDKSFKDLLTKYKNVKRLYFDGKAQIDALTGQIVHLQNAVANQRMSQSRTALDDNEYSTRWNRLNGAINNLSFNIRKDWRSVPQWLVSYVSADALKTGKAEMTAVGRAVISRWLMEEVFNKCFHPGLDPQLSQSLKEIELNIRHNAYTMTSQEEFDALTNKVVNWRMTTLEGLHRQLNSPSTADNRTAFTAKATSTLTACLYQFLNNPPPAGVEGSTSMIVELAVGIAANLPLESRDVAITYPLPGEIVQPRVMEVEKAPLPPLEGQKEDGEDDDKKKEEGDDKSGKAKTGTLIKANLGAVGEDNDSSKSVRTDADMDNFAVAVPSDANRVRFAGFMALEVRGRQVLWKAPIWTL